MICKNSHIVVLGAGESGQGAILLAKKQGYTVSLSDNQTLSPSIKKWLLSLNISFQENGHTLDFLEKANIIVKSPGIPYNIPVLKEINKNKNIKIIDEVEFASFFASEATHIAITGTNGKTTTTSLIYHILSPVFKAPCLVGNIGYSVSRTLANQQPDLLVTELSSFQIEGLDTYQPHTVVMTNITADHLDRYQGDFECYATTKWQLTKNLTSQDFLVLNLDDPCLHSLNEKRPSKAKIMGFSLDKNKVAHLEAFAYADQDILHFHCFDRTDAIAFNKLPFQGAHQKKNVMASVLTTLSIKPTLSIQKISDRLLSFQPIAHRMEPCGEINGISFVNDSKATNVEATKFALESFEKPIVWIIGGYDKGNDYGDIIPLAKRKVRYIVCLGEDNSKLFKAFAQLPCTETHNMKDAVTSAVKMSKKGDVILLSPMCASFDLFDNYMDRGDQFKVAVDMLKKGGSHG